MIEYFKEKFRKIADEYLGQYEVEEFIEGGEPISYHKIIIPNREYDIIFEFDFGEGSICTIKTYANNANESKFFKLKKRNPFILLFNKNKSSLIVESRKVDVDLKIKEILLNTGLEDISKTTLFEPNIKFEKSGSITYIETILSLAFEDKENSIKPLIEFHKKTIEYLKE